MATEQTAKKATKPRTTAENAEQISKHLHEAITHFDRAIDESDEVALKLISFGGDSTLAVDGVGAIGRTMIRFTGIYNGRPATIIQSISQLNFLLYSKPRNVEQPRRVIGFLDPLSAEIDAMEKKLEEADLSHMAD